MFVYFCCCFVRSFRSAPCLAVIPSCCPSCLLRSHWRTTRPFRPADSPTTPLFMTTRQLLVVVVVVVVETSKETKPSRIPGLDRHTTTTTATAAAMDQPLLLLPSATRHFSNRLNIFSLFFRTRLIFAHNLQKQKIFIVSDLF